MLDPHHITFIPHDYLEKYATVLDKSRIQDALFLEEKIVFTVAGSCHLKSNSLTSLGIYLYSGRELFPECLSSGDNPTPRLKEIPTLLYTGDVIDAACILGFYPPIWRSITLLSRENIELVKSVLYPALCQQSMPEAAMTHPKLNALWWRYQLGRTVNRDDEYIKRYFERK